MSNAKDINDSTFESEVLKSENLTLVDFWAPWCGPCRKMGPLLDEIASEFEGRLKVVKINTDENLKTAKEYQIRGLPRILLFKDREAKEVMVDLKPKSAIISNIEKML